MNTVEVMGPGSADKIRANKRMARGWPACWTWVLPKTDPETLDEGDRWQLMAKWHRERCAVCGMRRPYNLINDHDHETGLIRGFLCRSCNTLESHGNQIIFDRYRLVCPAMVFGLKYPYTGWGY